MTVSRGRKSIYVNTTSIDGNLSLKAPSTYIARPFPLSFLEDDKALRATTASYLSYVATSAAYTSFSR